MHTTLLPEALLALIRSGQLCRSVDSLKLQLLHARCTVYTQCPNRATYVSRRIVWGVHRARLICSTMQYTVVSVTQGGPYLQCPLLHFRTAQALIRGSWLTRIPRHWYADQAQSNLSTLGGSRKCIAGRLGHAVLILLFA
jgi:hypothetical protein